MDTPLVLIVEDNPDDVELTLLAFKANHFPYKVIVANDGDEALDLLRARDQAMLPALILLDLKMLRMSGLEALEQIRADARLADIPVSMLTSSSLESDKRRAYELGVIDYIQKPVELSEFDAVVARISGLMETILHHGAKR